jgi:site-specific recombinase XerD
MELVYFFCDSAVIRVPLFDYDRRLFKLLASKGGGIWDNVRQEFVFTHSGNTASLNYTLPGIPCVKVDASSPIPVSISGFLERPWEENPPAKVPSVTGAEKEPGEKPEPLALSAPEKLNGEWRHKLETELRYRKYSPKTRNAYIYFIQALCRTLQKTPEELNSGDIKQFLAVMEKNGYSASAMNLALSAVKFFFRNVLKNDSIREQRRPRQDKILPSILSKDEIKKIIDTEENPKHRLLLTMAYSSGLRVSELVALKKEHIDLSRKVVYIKAGKGRKDRCTVLSEKAALVIGEYFSSYGIQTWLFPGQPSSRHLSIRSAQHIFEKAVMRAGIAKKTSIHGLRHTFATHLLENGTDIRYIQDLLGHASIRTTERYTHVARRNVLSVQSPFDTIS